ncbi:MAG: beta galactosidase jelly roll domain-containing protein [Prevotella sp.]|nr:beta galactosidase jelly roll domain-containing protein [Prevotella sp.]
MRVLMDKYAPKADDTTPQAWAPQGFKIKTRWADDVDPEQPLPDYPRPQLVRQEWQNLNGLWQYAITPQTQRTIPTAWDGWILVPFAVESSLSGVMRMLDKNNYLWYQRSFTVPADWAGRRVMLNFGAVDYTARVYVNGTNVGSHTGGFTAFSFDITDRLTEGENTIVVMVQDNTDEATQPLGKQRFNPGGAGSIWYTQVSGIWQTVWLEPVAANSITDVRTTPDVDKQQLSIRVATAAESATAQVSLVLSLRGTVVAEATGRPGEDIVVSVPNAQLWTPTSPTLYDLQVRLTDGSETLDEARSYAALRKISYAKTADGEWRLQLNNRDLFHFGLLDQGYWPDGLYTAPTDEALRFDVEQTKALGFNMIRKHMKVEPQRWYYLCDSIGLMVWQDMPALGRSDEAWTPRDWSTKNGQQTTAVENNFRSQWRDIIQQHYSSPSIVVWTPFNEGWGQFKTADIVSFTREQDPTRLVDPASGGNHFENAGGDMVDLHDYDRPPHIYLYNAELPVVLGEFGGLGRNVDGHRWYDRDATTYVNYQTEGLLTNAYVQTVEAVIAMAQDAQANDGQRAAFCSAVYTQTTDVETEVNGLYTYDRALLKLTENRVRQVNERLTNLYGNAEPDAIRSIVQSSMVNGQSVYSLSGQRLDRPARGVNIMVSPQGRARKVMVR